MGFSIANKAFEEMFGEGIAANERLYGEFIDMLKDCLREEKGTSAGKMAKWIEAEKPLCTFTCRQDAVEALCRNMTREKVPYILVNETNGKIGFIIRESDVQHTKKITRKTLSEMSAFCRIMSGSDTGMQYLKGKDEDKTMLVLGGLDRDEAFYFTGICAKVVPGETIGIDHMPDGTYTITGHAKTLMRARRGLSFPAAVAESVILMNGESGKEEREEVKKRLDFLFQKSRGFPDKNGGTASPVWIVGRGNCFVKRTESGFDAGHALTISDSVILETDYTCRKEDKKYRQRMNSALSRTTGHICLYKIADVLDYYRSPPRFMKSVKTAGQEAVIQQASEIVAEKVAKEQISRMDGKWEYKFRHYQKEMRRVIEGAALGRIPKGYTRAGIMSVRSIAKTYGISLKSMLPGLQKYAELDSYVREAGMPRVTDLEKLLARYSGERQRDGAEKERDESRQHGSADRGDR